MICLTIINNGEKHYFTKNCLSVDDLIHESLIALSNVDYSTVGNTRMYSRVLVYYMDTDNMSSYLHFNILTSYSVSESLVRFNITVKHGIEVPGYTYRFNISNVEPYNLPSLDLVKEAHEAFASSIEKNRDDKEKKEKDFLEKSSVPSEVE